MVMMIMMQIDSYSAFYDNGHMSQTELHDVLTARHISNLYIVGLATDYCVYYTAMDASTLGLYTLYTVGSNVTRGTCFGPAAGQLLFKLLARKQLANNSALSAAITMIVKIT